MSSQEDARKKEGTSVLTPLTSLEFPGGNFDNPRLEWIRLFSEILGTFLLVIVAAGGVPFVFSFSMYNSCMFR